jgi:hypothetical protein
MQESHASTDSRERNSSGSNSQRFSDASLMAAYHAPWMDPSRGRELPRQRAAAAAAALTLQRQQQLEQQQRVSSPAHDDLTDPITQSSVAVDSSSCSWVPAYRRASHKQLPKQLREFGWRMLHAGVKVGARRMLSAGRQQPVQFTCIAQQCQQQQQLETFSHLFIECPVAAAVWQWFAQLWQQVQPGAVVPISSRVLLLDDFSVWAPAADKQLLWTHLRLLLLESIWSVRSCSGWKPGSGAAGVGGTEAGSSRAAEATATAAATAGTAAAAAPHLQRSNGGDGLGPAASTPGSSSYTAKAVACRFRSELQNHVLQEWDRVGVDIRVGSGIPVSWLGGRSPVIAWEDFQRKWAGLYGVSQEGADRNIVLRVSTAGL